MSSVVTKQFINNSWRILFFLFWVSFGIGLFLYYSVALANALLDESAVVAINKGAFYGLGVSVALGALLFGDIIPTQVLQKPLPKAKQKLVVRAIVLGMALAFVLPHVIHYSLASYLANRGYEECEAMSHRWLFARTIVFTDSPDSCNLSSLQ